MFAIFQKVLRCGLPSSHGINSAFTRDSLQGSIYVEADNSLAVVKALQGIPGVAHSPGSHTFGITLVDIGDRPLLLNMEMNGLHSSIKPLSWVRFKKGLYRGDLALVRDVDGSTQHCEVYVVPRLAYDGKRKRGNRPPPAYFDVARAERAFKSKAEIHNCLHLF